MYRVIFRWVDPYDGHEYKPGEEFPFDGRKVTEERLNALLSGENWLRRALIVKDDEKPIVEPKQRRKAIKTAK